ncbi:MAG: hypothetical protein O2877_00415 [bacterium]|nr:hypothetical protein [bacterium]
MHDGIAAVRHPVERDRIPAARVDRLPRRRDEEELIFPIARLHAVVGDDALLANLHLLIILDERIERTTNVFRTSTGVVAALEEPPEMSVDDLVTIPHLSHLLCGSYDRA